MQVSTAVRWREFNEEEKVGGLRHVLGVEQGYGREIRSSRRG